MNIYLVTRDEKHDVGWDETNTLVVATELDQTICVVKLIGRAVEGVSGIVLTDAS